MQIINVKFLRSGKPSGRGYSYYASEDIAVGDIVQINEKQKGIAVEVDLPITSIAGFEDKVKTIVGKVEENKKPLDFDDIAGSEDLCKHCDWKKGEIPHACDGVCEGKYCEQAYGEYSENFDGGRE